MSVMFSLEKVSILKIQQPFVLQTIYHLSLFDPNQIKVRSFHCNDLALHINLNEPMHDNYLLFKNVSKN